MSVWLSHYTQPGRKQNPVTGNTDHGILPPLALLEGPSANLCYTPGQGEDDAHPHALIPLPRGRGGTHCRRHMWAGEKGRKVVWFEILLPWSHHPWFHPSCVRDTSPYRQTPTSPAKWAHTSQWLVGPADWSRVHPCSTHISAICSPGKHWIFTYRVENYQALLLFHPQNLWMAPITVST